MTKLIYVAGPIFSHSERKFLEDLVSNMSKELNLHPINDFFLAHRDVGDVGIAGVGRDKAFFDDIKALDESEIVVAWLDGPDVDSGTAVEIGYAYAKGEKKILGLLTDRRKWGDSLEGVMVNNMIWGVCKEKGDIYNTIDKLVEKLKNELSSHN